MEMENGALKIREAAFQARDTIIEQGSNVCQKAVDVTDSFSLALQERGIPRRAALNFSRAALALLIALTPLASTAITLAICWLCISASIAIACLAACLAFGAGLLVLSFMGLAIMASWAFMITLLVTVAVGTALLIALGVGLTALVGLKVSTKLGGSVFVQLDRFTAGTVDKCMDDAPQSQTHVSEKHFERIPEEPDIKSSDSVKLKSSAPTINEA